MSGQVLARRSGVVMWPEILATAPVPRSRIEPDLTSLVNQVFGRGPMSVGRVFSLFRPDARPPRQDRRCGAVVCGAHPRRTDCVSRTDPLGRVLDGSASQVAEIDLAF
jgi:hypothetical protein